MLRLHPRLCLALGALVATTACDRSDGAERTAAMQHANPNGVAIDTAGLRAAPVPAEFQRGAELFQANCVACHGEAALGTSQGPPLVHIYYEPNHHADIAFEMAVGRGVRAHHWNFGDMPPVAGLSQAEVTEIVAYVRWLQREAGVY